MTLKAVLLEPNPPHVQPDSGESGFFYSKPQPMSYLFLIGTARECYMGISNPLSVFFEVHYGDIATATPPCVICNQSIDFDQMKYVDEKDKPVHELCYVERVVKKKAASAGSIQSKFDCTA